MSARSVSRSRVVPGIAVTIARLAFSSALNRLDLPTFGAPTIATCGAFAHQPAARRLRSSASMRAITPAIDVARLLRRDEVIALVGKIERRFELGDDVEQLLLDRRDRRRQRAFELIERGPRLQRRDRVDQIRDGLGLDEIELLIEERAQRELARLGEPRAGVDRRAQDRAREQPGLPCAEISTTSSPVYERGATKYVTTT